MSRGAEARTASAWYVHADGRVWGPYAEQRLKGFLAEGRVSRSTMIGDSDQGPFIPAGLQGDLAHLFAETDALAARPVQPAATPSAAPAPPRPLPTGSAAGASGSSISAPADRFAALDAGPSPAAPGGVANARSCASLSDSAPKPAHGVAEAARSQAGGSRPLLVFAALRSFGAIAFETVLAQHGPYERIGDGLWLIRARLGSSALRNALSRRLRQDDALLVVEADLEKAAWFNLNLAEERRVRALWAP